MEFDHRKHLLESNLTEVVPCSFKCNPFLNKEGYCFEPCFRTCPDVCTKLIIMGPPDDLPPPFVPNPPPSPPPPPPPKTAKSDIYLPPSHPKQLMESSMMITASMIGAALVLVILFSICTYIRHRNDLRRRRRRASGVVFDTQQDFLDEDHAPVLDHPIWYIHTVGLPQSVIDSITVCKFRKDEALIDGTDCSVCLSEFEEDEDLRLLPKCSHAFHIPCIDTWLRSHKNCPLCRAPIVCATAQVSVPEPNLSGSGSRDSVQDVENVESSGGAESLGSGSSEVGVAVDETVLAIPMAESSVESSRKVSSNSIVPVVGGCDPRALSDLADNRHVTEEDIQPMRRSVSMDSLSALRLYRDVADVIPEEGSSNAQLVRAKSPNSGAVTKHGSASSGLSKLIRSSSIGFSLQMGPISMKRPFLSSRKLFSSKHGRSLSSILPL